MQQWTDIAGNAGAASDLMIRFGTENPDFAPSNSFDSHGLPIWTDPVLRNAPPATPAPPTTPVKVTPRPDVPDETRDLFSNFTFLGFTGITAFILMYYLFKGNSNNMLLPLLLMGGIK